MSSGTDVVAVCPECGLDLFGLARFCPRCEDYVDNLGAGSSKPPPKKAPAQGIPDDRLEAPVRLGIREVFELHGFKVYDLEQERPTRQTPGPTDLLVFGFGRILFAEVKRPKRRGEAHDGLSPDQRGFRDDVLRNGGEHEVFFDEADALAWALAAKGGRS